MRELIEKKWFFFFNLRKNGLGVGKCDAHSQQFKLLGCRTALRFLWFVALIQNEFLPGNDRHGSATDEKHEPATVGGGATSLLHLKNLTIWFVIL